MKSTNSESDPANSYIWWY